MSNPRNFPNGVSTEPMPGFQSGTGMCTCCSAAKYYEHPVSPFWGGANKKVNKRVNKKNQKGGNDLTAPQEVATAGQQNGAVLYGGANVATMNDVLMGGARNKRVNKKNANKKDDEVMMGGDNKRVNKKVNKRVNKKNQKGGENSLIPTTPSVPADLSGQGPFTDQHANWMQRGTGSGVPETKVAVPEESFSTALETSGGARKKRTYKKKSQKGGEENIDAAIDTGLAALAGGKRKTAKKTTKKTTKKSSKKQNGGGSDWVMTAHSRGPINYPTQSEQMFRSFNKTGEMISNADLYWAPLESPMFKNNGPTGYNAYNPY